MSWQGLEVIDAHCHVYPDKIAALAVKGTDDFYNTVGNHDGTVATLARLHAEAGIDRAVIQSVATTPHQVGSINRFIAATVAAAPDRFIGLGTLHQDCEDMAAEVDQIVELGLHGVKMHPDIQRFRIDEPRNLRIFEECQRAGLPVLLHTGDYRYNFSNPDNLIPVLKAFPNLTVIGAHLGGWSVWREAAEKLPGMPNLYVDCSSCFQFSDLDVIRECIECFGEDRVLFGTDYPMWDPATELGVLLSFGYSREKYRKILAENAKKVFKFE